MEKSYKYILYIFGFFILISLFLDGSENTANQTAVTNPNNNNQIETSDAVEDETDTSLPNTNTASASTASDLFSVTRVVDGDTIDVSINGQIERIRMIGINTPETVDPRKTVECFGVEASNKAKALLSGKKVRLEIDNTQGERDKYSRLLRYVFLETGTNFGLVMIQQGYAYEYTYDLPYKYQSEYKSAQKEAEESNAGLWGDKCNGNTKTLVSATPVTTTNTTQSVETNSCIIKGNISSKKEKIYHVPGCGHYDKTVIDETKGEKFFCSEQEALDAGWRKALNCN